MRFNNYVKRLENNYKKLQADNRSEQGIKISEKWAVVFAYSIQEGICRMARTEDRRGDVALFDSREEAEEWVAESGEIDSEFSDINYVKFRVLDCYYQDF